MIAAAMTFGPSLISPFVVSTMPSSSNFHHIPECAPVTQSASIDSTESANRLPETIFEEPVVSNVTTAATESSLAMLRPKEVPKTMAEPMQSSARRVIFPELYHRRTSISSPDMTKATKAASPILQKLSSFDSRESVDKHNRLQALLSSKSAVEESPKCVSALNTVLLMLPRLDSGPRETPKVDPSSMIIPPFAYTAGSSNLAHQEKQRLPAPVVGTPAYKKRLASPFVNSSQMISFPPSVTPKLRGHTVVNSILRKKIDSVPSMVSMSSSEGSLPDLNRKVGFDPRVWVCEFQRDKTEQVKTWFSPSEMDRFKRHAIERIHAYSELVPTGTGRLVRKPVSRKAFFTHPALSGTDDEDIFAIQKVARTEVNNILVVDPHDLCGKLFAKLFQQILPHASVVTARSSDEAMSRIEQQGPKNSFDIILVEERLKLMQDRDDHQGSGSALIRLLKEHEPEALFIGVSAHYAKDKEKLQEGGAGLTWPKPPPAGDCAMRNEILKKILFLRGKEETAMKYFP